MTALFLLQCMIYSSPKADATVSDSHGKHLQPRE